MLTYWSKIEEATQEVVLSWSNLSYVACLTSIPRISSTLAGFSQTNKSSRVFYFQLQQTVRSTLNKQLWYFKALTKLHSVACCSVDLYANNWPLLGFELFEMTRYAWEVEITNQLDKGSVLPPIPPAQPSWIRSRIQDPGQGGGATASPQQSGLGSASSPSCSLMCCCRLHHGVRAELCSESKRRSHLEGGSCPHLPKCLCCQRWWWREGGQWVISLSPLPSNKMIGNWQFYIVVLIIILW